ncbi:uncharacterized protein LOC128920239 isoform X2 [Zeugodacus cucurbitae]|uniref:uncharacterized protein LOC128920239 isoform X2 n=1 Tax=Zeugodacus cucurbitae TaxID=28588 RepID=UPI0023D96A74|nr:uncharacterized protein LOC128920239 isoform X2 [Zeugodacus cucurbitae]
MGKVYEYKIFQKFHSKVFIIYRTEYEEISFTFNVILKQVTAVLRQFSRYNISPNTGIALRLEGHSPYSIILILSILNHNCYFIPLHSTNSYPNFEGVLNEHGAKYLITDLKYDENRYCKEIGLLKVLDKKMYFHENTGLDRKLYNEGYDLCYSISTSGSTGLPKIVQVPYSCVEPNILVLCSLLKLSEKDVIYLCAPSTFDPFVVDLFLALNSGATLLICPANLRLNPKKMLSILWPRGQRGLKGTTILQATPSFFRLFGEVLIREVILHENNSLRCLILGGENFPSRKEWNSWLPNVPVKTRIFNIYGTTEVSCWSTIHECDFNDQWERAPIGTALDDDTTLYITDSNGKELLGTCEGVLKIGSATRKCYIPSTDGLLRHKNDEMCFRNTGDLVFRDEFGRVFYIGRTDSIIKRLGVRFNLESLQQKIQKILNSTSSNVKCIWHEETRKLVCFVQTISNADATELMHIRRRLIQNLLEIDRPDDIVFISSFPLNSHGKIDSQTLMKKIANKSFTSSADPKGIFHTFITETLGVDLMRKNASEASIENMPGLNMSFNAAGGTSFQALSLVSQIGAILEHQCDQNELLAMLLSSQHSLETIMNFLAACSVSKLQVISKTLPVNSSSYVKKRFKFLWSTSLNKCVDSAPCIVGDKWVCVGSHSHILKTLDTQLGAPMAVLELPDRIECKVEIVSNMNTSYIAVVGCYDQHVYAFNFTNGHIYWRIDLGGLIKAKPLSCATGLVVATYGEQFNVVCISLKTKNYIWRKKIGTKGIFANPVAMNSREVIICTLDGSYCRILSNSGILLWLRKCESPIFSSPVVISEDSVILVAEVAGKVHICNAENGELMKTFCAGYPIFSALTILEDIGSKRNVLFGCYDKHVYCLRYQSLVEKTLQRACKLDLLWKKQLESNIFASPLVISLQEAVYVLCCSTSGLIALLHIETGGENFPSRKEWNSWLPNVPVKTRIFNIYGTTEVSCWSTIHECDFNDQWERAPIGTALDDDTTLYITDSNGKELLGTCEGVLKIGSATRKCYIPSTDGLLRHKNDEMCFRNTGDLVFRDEFGRVFYIGRTDSIIKRLGVRFNLESLQQKIQKILNSTSSNVKCIWHEETRKLVCFVQTISNADTTELMHIRRRLIQNLLEIDRPDDIVFISSFPLNSHGKIDSQTLMKKIANKSFTSSADPKGIFHTFITETLGVDLMRKNASEASIENMPGLNMSFNAAGGTSFQALSLVSQIGAILEHQCDQNELLAMLLSSQHSLETIMNFLAACSVSKLQVISKTLPVNSSSYVKKRFKFLWSTSLNKCVDSAPCIVGDKWVCVGSHSHILKTLDTQLGAPMAVLELPDRIECKVEIVSNMNTSYIAVVGCYDQHVYAFNFTNGHIYWRIDLGGLIKAKPLSCATGLVVATYGEQFNAVCISLKTKNYIWRKKIGTKGIFANPVAMNSREVIICTLDGSYCRILSNSGILLWLRKCESPIFSSLVVISEDSVILVAEVAGKVHICNAENGGENFPSRKEWNSWLPNVPVKTRIFNIYGTTEVSCWSTIHECDFNDQWERAPIGTALDDDTTLYITDSNGKELLGTCEGVLKIGSATRKCYIPSTDGLLRHKNDEMCFRNTGDLVFRDEFGRVFYIGRTDSIIKRLGVRFNLESLQQKIQKILNSTSSNIKCIWHEETRKLVCFVQTISNADTKELMHIRRRLIQNLLEIDRPDDIVFISSFPLNSHGKIDSQTLMKKIANKSFTSSADPKGIFHTFITETLGVDLMRKNASEASIENMPGLNMSFNAAGGTSFQALSLVSQIGAILEHQCDQNELLAMLLSSQHSLETIMNFLAACSVSKLQVISKTLPVNSSSYVKKRFKFLWSTSLNKCVDSAPCIVGDKWVCVGSHSHILKTLDTQLGAPMAVLELPDRIECKVEIVSNMNTSYIAVVGCYDQHVYAFNFTNGHIYWRIDLGGLIKAKPLSCATGLVVATYGEQFNAVCISLKTKNYIWRKKIGTKGIFANPVAMNSREVIICTLDGSYCRILSNSGILLWLRKCESPIFSSPVVISEDSVILVAEVAGKVHICNAENGELMKTFCAGYPIFSALTILEDIGSKRNVLFGCYDKHVYCLRYQSLVEKTLQRACKLDLLWKKQLESNIFASPLVISLQEAVYVLCCSTSGLIALLHIETGEMIAKYKLSAEIFSTPCNLNNQIFIGCRDNFLYSFSIH